MSSQVNILYCFNDKKFDKDTLVNCLDYVPKTVADRIWRYHRWQDAQACLIGHLLIRKYVFLKGQSWSSVWRNQYGKPYLDEGLFFNISHTDGLIALAKSKFEIGMDVECIQHCDFDAILKLITSEHKRRDIRDSQNPIMAFYRYWTQKEACVKQIGKGLSIPLKDFEIDEYNFTYLDGRALAIIDVDCESAGHVASLAVPKNQSINLNTIVTKLNIHQIISQ